MIQLVLLLSFFMVKCSNDVHVDVIAVLSDTPSNEDIAESIINGFVHEDEKVIRPKIKPILTEIIERESEDTKRVLIRVSHLHTPLSQSENDPIAGKALELFTDALARTIEYEEHQKQSRCTRFTTIALSAGLALAGTAVGAAVSAAITNATSNC